MTRYIRRPKAKPGQLVVRWANTRSDGADLYFCNGPGTNRCDRSLLYSMIGAERMRIAFPSDPEIDRRHGYAFMKSFAAELEARGYDLTTLRFSIQKKRPEPTGTEEP